VKLLLDTHAVLWWLDGNSRLGAWASRAISDPANPCCLSVVSVFEIETKSRLGRLTLPDAVTSGWDETISQESWRILPISLAHACRAGNFSVAHGDPFDRILAAQAELEDMTLVSCDPAFAAFGVSTLW